MDETEFDVDSLSDAELDAAWDDEVEVTPNEQQDTEPEADQPTGQPAETPAEDAEKPQDEPAAEPTPGDGGVKEADQPSTFTLKHLDETRTVDRDEVVKLAQQGMDYDRVRTERDQLRTYRDGAEPALALVKAYAEKNGMSIPDYIDFARKQELMQTGMSEQTADVQISLEKRETDLKAREQAIAEREARENAQTADREKQEETTRQNAEARRKEMTIFLQKYPGVDPRKDIPREVWDEVSQGVSLLTAYTDHRNKQLEAELAAERQNKANAQKSTGSMTTKGAGVQDEIDKWWNEE